MQTPEFIYNFATAGLSDGDIAVVGKLRTPLRIVIEHESDLMKKKGGVRDQLFNVEKSNGFADTIVAQNEFPIFGATAEGAAAPEVSISETYKKVIENIQFMQEFNITAKMMEDANYGVGADAKRRAANFTRAYYSTMHEACAFALANGTETTGEFAGTSIDLKTGDGKALFATDHVWGKGTTTGTQSNYFKGADAFGSEASFEDALIELALKISDMNDENGKAMGYTADTIIVPGNCPILTKLVKKVCGTDQPSGGSTPSYINTQYGLWNVVPLHSWRLDNPTKPEVLVMSSEANKNLAGNMFYNRIPLAIRDFVDVHTGNYTWVGRCRFGVGFGNYKHIVKLTADESVSATAL